MTGKMVKVRNLLASTAVCSMLAGVGMVHAQTNDGVDHKAPPASIRSTSSDIPDIIVTAQRRDENLSRTPVSVAVLSADTLAKANVVSEQDLRFATPGLSVRANATSNQLNYALRGQSQDAFSGTLPGVLPYINEVQIGGGGGSTAFYDLQSVQVLKGPQGTLFGRSATGGAVLFTTARPTEQFGGYASVLGGNYSAFKAEAALNVPILGEALMVRAAGFYQRRDGFQHNLYTDRNVGKIDKLGARFSAKSILGAVTNEFTFDYFRSRSENTVAQVSGVLPFTGGGNGNPPFVPTQFLYAGIATPEARATGIATLVAFTGAPPTAAAGFYDAYFADPRHPATGLGGLLAAQSARSPYTVNSAARNAYNANNYIVTNATTITLSDNMQLKSIFGYTSLYSDIAIDSDGTPFALAESSVANRGGNTNKTRQISNEMQLLGSLFNDRLAYVVGFYFSDERVKSLFRTDFFDIAFGGLRQQNDAILKYRTYAGYGQGTYKINDSGLSATIGLRYTSERNGKIVPPTDSIRLTLGDPAPAGFDYDQQRTFNKLSWHIGLQNQINDDLFLYTSSGRAYKSGGFNKNVAPFVGSAQQGGDAYDAESVTDVEVGAKYKGVLAGVPLRLATAFFHNWVSGSQRTAYTVIGANPSTLTVNVPKARVYGVELDGSVKPLQALTIEGSLNYTHSEYKDGRVFVVGQPQLFDRVPDAPKFTGTVYANVEVPVTSTIVATVGGDLYFQSKSFTSPRSFNNAGTALPNYAIAGFRAGIEDHEAGWSLTANLKNAFDRVYYIGGLGAGEVYQTNTFVIGEPQTFTIEARLNF